MKPGEIAHDIDRGSSLSEDNPGNLRFRYTKRKVSPDRYWEKTGRAISDTKI
jgi:hypothetical protein